VPVKSEEHASLLAIPSVGMIVGIGYSDSDMGGKVRCEGGNPAGSYGGFYDKSIWVRERKDRTPGAVQRKKRGKRCARHLVGHENSEEKGKRRG